MKEAGLPTQLEASVTQLFEAIHQGHTAQYLSNEEADLWAQTLTEFRDRNTLRCQS